jgi:MoxR-like ATPase
MADYYSILARAVSRLETNNAQVRQELYEYARAILNAHFDRSDPQISALGVIDERVEFETAILRVEAESPSRSERSPETFRDAIPDFASLLREPVLPAPSSNNVGVSPPPSHLIPKKLTSGS